MMHKAMSSGDLGKGDSLRKISHGDGRSETRLLLSFFFFLFFYFFIFFLAIFPLQALKIMCAFCAQGSGQDEVLGEDKAGREENVQRQTNVCR